MNTQTINFDYIAENQNAGLVKGFADDAGKQAGFGKEFLALLNKVVGDGQERSSQDKKGMVKATGSRTGWLDLFRKALVSCGGKLKDLSISSKAVGTLKKLLVGDGVSDQDAENFLKKLFGDKNNREIGLCELFDRISELKTKTGKGSDDFLVESSAVPHLENLLRSLGLDSRQAGGIIADARKQGGLLSLKRLWRRLKAFSAEATNLPTTKGCVATGKDTQQALMAMGMDKEAANLHGAVSLKEFVQLIEEKVASLAHQSISEQESKKQVKALLGNVTLRSPKENKTALAASRQGAGLKGFPFIEANGNKKTNKTNKRGLETRTKIASQKQGPGIDNQGSAGNIRMVDFEKMAGLRSHVEQESSEVDKLVEFVKQRHGKTAGNTLEGRTIPGAMPDRVAGGGYAAKLDARSIPLHVVRQVGNRLGLALKRGESNVRLQLKPPHLGSIQLNLAMKDKTLKIAVVAEHQYVKDLIVSHAHELRQALVDQGVALQKLDVEISYNFGHSMANAEKGFSGSKRWSNNVGFSPDVVANEAMNTDASARVMQGDGMLDMFA